MATKYIVNNAPDQIIDGNVVITGNATITGNLEISSKVKYRALLTQTGTLIGTNIDAFNMGLIIGETYTITNYVSGDDFSNVAEPPISGNINETGCVFVAKGETPNIWANSTELTSSGELVVNVLENTLGYDLEWISSPFGPQGGYYVAINSNTGPLLNQFPRNKTDIKVGIKYPFDFFPPIGGLTPIGISGIGNMFNKDSYIFIEMYYDGDLSPNALYYTPIEITVNQDTDTTIVNVYGENVSSFPYGNVSIDLFSGDHLAESFYTNSGTTVNNMEEMVDLLNNSEVTNFLGKYSINPAVENGVILEIPTNLMNRFSPDGELTFEVFND